MQKVLLFTGTRFAGGNSILTGEIANGFSGLPAAQAAIEIRNTQINQLLSLVMVDIEPGWQTILWEMVTTTSFLYLHLGSCPMIVEHRYSLDPYSFLSEKQMN